MINGNSEHNKMKKYGYYLIFLIIVYIFDTIMVNLLVNVFGLGQSIFFQIIIISIIFLNIGLIIVIVLLSIKRTKKKKIIKRNLLNSRIKNSLLELKKSFSRFKISDIVKKSGIANEKLIVTTLMDMIQNKELQAEFFKSTKEIAIVQEFSTREIDDLLESFKNWEDDQKKVD